MFAEEDYLSHEDSDYEEGTEDSGKDGRTSDFFRKISEEEHGDEYGAEERPRAADGEEGPAASGGGGPAPADLARERKRLEGLIEDIKEIDRSMLNELILVIQNIGTLDEEGDFVPGEDCHDWLCDLQR